MEQKVKMKTKDMLSGLTQTAWRKKSDDHRQRKVGKGKGEGQQK